MLRRCHSLFIFNTSCKYIPGLYVSRKYNYIHMWLLQYINWILASHNVLHCTCMDSDDSWRLVLFLCAIHRESLITPIKPTRVGIEINDLRRDRPIAILTHQQIYSSSMHIVLCLFHHLSTSTLACRYALCRTCRYNKVWWTVKAAADILCNIWSAIALEGLER